MLKHNLPVEDLCTTLPPKEDLKYAYIDDKKIYHVIIISKLSVHEDEKLLGVLKKH
jgi:hypothetical protein